MNPVRESSYTALKKLISGEKVNVYDACVSLGLTLQEACRLFDTDVPAEFLTEKDNFLMLYAPRHRILFKFIYDVYCALSSVPQDGRIKEVMEEYSFTFNMAVDFEKAGWFNGQK